MKKVASFSAILLALFTLMNLGILQAQEVSVMPAMTPSQVEAQTFALTVTEQEQLVANPRHAFTAGMEAPGTTLPYLISQPKPIRYPRWAVNQGWQGRVIVALDIFQDGSVGKTLVMESSGHAALDRVATEAMKAWKFHPAETNGKPIHTCIQVPVTFELKK